MKCVMAITAICDGERFKSIELPFLEHDPVARFLGIALNQYCECTRRYNARLKKSERGRPGNLPGPSAVDL